MSLSTLLLWGLVGWCGTPWPRPWPWPPGPGPMRNTWLTGKLVGVVGGVVGGLIFTQVWPVEGIMSGIDAAATAIGAWAGAVFLSNLVAIGTWPTPEKPQG